NLPPRDTNPLDNFWMTPAMGLRMEFSFAQSVIGMVQMVEQKRAAAETAKTETRADIANTQSAPAPIPREIPLPPIPPPARFLRY
ncbi:MAG TPA: hypothetical protein PLW48_12100, partial [Alphaproteobacteria bacterium]|nr:hypothetical protein [Alphaproteobacteria bacterium]